MRRRILRIDVTGGGLGGASGAAPIIRYGRSGEVQAALYTGAQPVGGHYRELPNEMFNLSIVHLIGSAPGKRRGIEIVNLFPAFKCCAAGISIANENFRIRVDVKKGERKRHEQTLPSNGGCTGVGRSFIPKTKTFNLHLHAMPAFNPRLNNIPLHQTWFPEGETTVSTILCWERLNAAIEFPVEA